MVDWSGGVFASCMPRVQLYVNACNGWPQFALQHHWLLPINCHFLRLFSVAGRGIATVSSATEESDLYLFHSKGPASVSDITTNLADIRKEAGHVPVHHPSRRSDRLPDRYNLFS